MTCTEIAGAIVVGIGFGVLLGGAVLLLCYPWRAR
jgi:hypothetical protein